MKTRSAAGVWLAVAAGIGAQAHAQQPVTNPSGMLMLATPSFVVGQPVPVNASCREGAAQLQWTPPNLLGYSPQRQATPTPQQAAGVVIGAVPGAGTLTLKCVVTGKVIPDGPSVRVTVNPKPTGTATSPAPPLGPTTPPAGVPAPVPPSKIAQDSMDATKGLYDRIVGICRSTPGCVPR